MIRFLITLALLAGAPFATAEPLRIAVASNFESTFAALLAAYAQRSDEKIEATTASTGVLCGQIVDGVPFAALFAADSDCTAKLVGAGRAKAENRLVYAIGHLVLWTPKDPSSAPSAWLADDRHRIAVADPDTAPYGAAAQQVLTALKLWPAVQPRLFVGADVAHAFQAIADGTVPGGFVAESQLVAHFHGVPPAAEIWRVPQNLYMAIVQEAVVLDGPDAARAQAFVSFVGSEAGRAIVAAHGYAVLASPR